MDWTGPRFVYVKQMEHELENAKCEIEINVVVVVFLNSFSVDDMLSLHIQECIKKKNKQTKTVSIHGLQTTN